jgi:hypothetical protein
MINLEMRVTSNVIRIYINGLFECSTYNGVSCFWDEKIGFRDQVEKKPMKFIIRRSLFSYILEKRRSAQEEY